MANAQASDSSTVGTLPEIIVTAQRRKEALQETPLAVTAFSARDLQQKDVRTARDLVISTPNLQLIRPPGTDANFIEFSIRGFNISRPLIGVQQPVGIYIDDYFYPSLSGSLLRVSDLQSVEVLRGPQGTLFGQNSLGGAVRYNTILPNQTFSGHVETTLGERNRDDFSGAVNIPILPDLLAVRLTGASYKQNGYVKDTTDGKPVGNDHDKVARIQARYTPTSTISVDLTGEYVKSNIDGDDQVVGAIVGPGSFLDPLPRTSDRAPDPIPVTFLGQPDLGTVAPGGKGVIFPTTAVPNVYNLVGSGALTGHPIPGFVPYTNAFVGSCKYCSSGTTEPEFSDTTTKDVRSTITWSPIKALTVKSLTSYFDITNSYYVDADRTPADDSETSGTLHTHAFSQELQLGGALLNDRLNYVSGFYYFNYGQANTVNYFALAGPPPAAPSTVQRQSYALYAQASLKITSKLTATIGGRETLEDVNVTAGDVVPPSAEFSGFTPSYKLQYQFTRDLMGYLSASKGFRGGTINTVNPALYPQVPADRGLGKVNPDTAWSYEVGARTEFFNHHLQFNATIFDSEYKNIQVLLAYPPAFGPPIPQSILDNVGSAQMNGIELESRAAIGGLHLHGTLSTLYAHYTSINGSSILTDLTVHSYIEHAPRYTYSVGADYDFNLPKGDVLATIDYGYQDRQVAGNQDHVAEWLPSYGLLNGRLAWHVNEHVTASIEAKNLLNKFYIINSNNNLYYIGLEYYEPGEPRTISGTLQYKF